MSGKREGRPKRGVEEKEKEKEKESFYGQHGFPFKAR